MGKGKFRPPNLQNYLGLTDFDKTWNFNLPPKITLQEKFDEVGGLGK